MRCTAALSSHVQFGVRVLDSMAMASSASLSTAPLSPSPTARDALSSVTVAIATSEAVAAYREVAARVAPASGRTSAGASV